MRISQGLVAVVCAAVLGGCGGSDAPSEPRLTAAVGARLAASADAVAAAAERGDDCEAVRQARALQVLAIDAVNAGEVPPSLQEELLAGVNRLASSLQCAPPPPPPPPPVAPPPTAEPEDDEGEDDDDGGRGRGKGKGKDKDKDKKGRKGDDD